MDKPKERVTLERKSGSFVWDVSKFLQLRRGASATPLLAGCVALKYCCLTGPTRRPGTLGGRRDLPTHRQASQLLTVTGGRLARRRANSRLQQAKGPRYHRFRARWTARITSNSSPQRWPCYAQRAMRFKSQGYEVETLRIVTQPLGELVAGLADDAALAYLADIDQLGAKEHFLPNVGPAMLRDATILVRFICWPAH